jgi:hypothetical protein
MHRDICRMEHSSLKDSIYLHNSDSVKGQQKRCLARIARAMRRLPATGSLSDAVGVIASLPTQLTALRASVRFIIAIVYFEIVMATDCIKLSNRSLKYSVIKKVHWFEGLRWVH